MPDFGRWTSNGGDPSLNEINRTEKFIEALSLERQVYATDREEAELSVLLAGWRDDARRTPMSGIATPREAVAALDKATAQGRVRIPMALVGSMAAAVLCVGGFGAAVYGSGPGDALFGVRGAVFGTQQTARDVHVELASSELRQVQQLIDEGQWEQAQEKLQTITTTVATVDNEQRKQELVDRWQQLSVKVENRDPNATVPPDAPPVVLPEVTVTTTPPPGESPTEETPTSTPVSPTTSPANPTSPTSPGTTPTTAPQEPVPGSETVLPSTPAPSSAPETTGPEHSATSSPVTTEPTAPSPSSSAQPTVPATSSAPTAPATTARPTTSSAPAAEAPTTTTTVVTQVEPTSVPSAPPVRATTAAPTADEAEGPSDEIPLLPGSGVTGSGES